MPADPLFDNPLPIDAALARLEQLAVAGTSPDRMIRTIGEIVAAWADEADMHPAAAHARLEQMWDAVSRNATDLQEQIADFATTDKPALAAARRTLAALKAAEATLATTLGRL